MKVSVQQTYGNINFTKAHAWGKLIAITGSTQVIVQVFTFLCGILIVRWLSKEEYAFYVLGNTMLGTMVMLADSGISNGVMAEGGKVWLDKMKLGVVLATGLNLRKRFSIYSCLISIPILDYLLFDHGANWYTIVLITLSLVPAFYASISDSFYELAPKLHQDISPLQRNEAEVSLGRLLLSASFLFILPYTAVAFIANGIPRLYGNYKLKILTKKYADKNEQPDLVVRNKISRSVNRTLPIVIYHCLSGQISIWLVAFLGSTSSISELGALGRTSVVFGLVGSVYSTLVVPRFSRMEAYRETLMRNFLLVQLSAILISAVVLILIWVFSDQVLWVLGQKYSGLNYELVLMSLLGCINFISGVCSSLVISRGWFIKPYYLIGINFGSTVISLAFFSVSSLLSILYFTIVVTIIAYLLILIYGLIEISKTAGIAPSKFNI